MSRPPNRSDGRAGRGPKGPAGKGPGGPKGPDGSDSLISKIIPCGVVLIYLPLVASAIGGIAVLRT